jgi:hypothetical protein
MLCRGLPLFNRECQTLYHRKFKTSISLIRKVERVSKMGIFWGVRVVEETGVENVCIVASLGAKRVADENELEGTLVSMMGAAYSYWTAEFTRLLAGNGEFFHNGVRVTAVGEVSGGGGSGDLATGKFNHEIEGDVLRLRFIHESKISVIEWRPGLARDAAISLLYGLHEQRVKMGGTKKVSQTTATLRRKAKERIDIVIRDLAAVLSRGDLVSGRSKLRAFCSLHGLPPVTDQFLANAGKLLVQKSFIQRSFEDIQRYNERTMQTRRSAELFEELVRLGEYDGRLNARQLFALYEIGLFLSYSMPRITAMISAILSGGDPWMAAEAAEMLRREREEQRHQNAQEHDAEKVSGGSDGFYHDASLNDGFEEFDEPHPLPRGLPAALVPMMTILGLSELGTEKGLRTAWTARVRECHPDRLGPSATAQQLDEANQATAEVNMAYSVILDFLKSG